MPKLSKSKLRAQRLSRSVLLVEDRAEVPLDPERFDSTEAGCVPLIVVVLWADTPV